jgi:uncharacterized protein YciI
MVAIPGDAKLIAFGSALAAAAPFFKAGLFAEVKIVRWRKAYLDGVCSL